MGDTKPYHEKAGAKSRRTMLQTSLKGTIGFAVWTGLESNITGGAKWYMKERNDNALLQKANFISSRVRIVSRTEYEQHLRADALPPHWHMALYAEPAGKRLIRLGNPGWVSRNNGCTWSQHAPSPDYSRGLPYGYRRNINTSVVDPNTGRLVSTVNSLDTPGLDPNAIEPPLAQYTYYLRYRVSTDGGRSWVFDAPMVGEGDFTLENPFKGIHIGKSSFYVGDAGSIPIVTRKGKILVPCQTTPIGPDGKPYNPTGGHTYTDALVLIGTWTHDGRLSWKSSQRVKGNPARSTRGMIEPTMIEMPDGRILMVMRGSNGHGADPDYKLPAFKWYAVSEDGGYTWSQPEPWTYDNGENFFSPSSMSVLVKHSSGRFFWVGNISDENCRANSPRWPLVMGEVHPEHLTLIRDSLLVLDTKGPVDEDHGRVDLSHVSLVEDRESGEWVLTYPRCYQRYTYYQYIKLRIAVE